MASRSLNRVCVLGNLGRDAATNFTPSGVAKTTFSVACSRRWKDQASGEWKESTDWVNVVLWRSENLSNHLTKGTQVYVEGRLQTDKYEKDGRDVYQTYVNADSVILLGGKGGGEKQDRNEEPAFREPRSMPRSSRGGASSANDGWNSSNEITSDDVPFLRVAPMDGRYV